MKRLEKDRTLDFVEDGDRNKEQEKGITVSDCKHIQKILPFPSCFDRWAE